MRTKNSIINSTLNIASYVLLLIPAFIVRRIFLNCLGEDWLGLNSLFNNIIGFLSIMELGIGSAIVFSLYKPFARKDKVKIKGYLDYYAKFYKKVGNIILIAGLAIVPFLNIFINNEVSIVRASISFVLFLLNTYITYLFSYKSCILNVAQEEYKISIATSISKIAMSILQIVFLLIIPSFEVYLIIQLVVNFIYYVAINKYIDKQYEWLDKTAGQITDGEKASLTKNIKALFMHKIGGFIVYSTDNLMISYFINLAATSKFNSYNLVIVSAKNVVSKGLSGLTASIGNLLVCKDKKQSYDVHKKIFFITFWLVSFISISFYNVLDQFICIWMGKSQLLDKLTLIILIVNFYFSSMRGSVERFQEGSGNYRHDRYAPLCEAAINLVSSIILVKIIGLPGIFLGTLISNITVIFWTKPLVIYKYVFEEKLIEYYKMYFKYLFISFIPLAMTIMASMTIKTYIGIVPFLLNCIINTVIVNGVYILIFRKTAEFIYFKNLVFNILSKKKSKQLVEGEN